MEPTRAIRLLTVGLMVAFTGCASIVHGTRQSLRVESDPPASVKLDGAIQGTTPLTLRVSRKQSISQVELERPGCVTQAFKLEREFSGWYVGNIVFGGIIGLIVDASDGAMWNQYPDSLKATLNCPAPVAGLSPSQVSVSTNTVSAAPYKGEYL
jgi:hypothetical protein